MTRKLRVGVLFGGRSGEHEVSLVSAQSILEALDPDRYDVVLIGIAKDGRWLTGGNPLAELRAAADAESRVASHESRVLGHESRAQGAGAELTDLAAGLVESNGQRRELSTWDSASRTRDPRLGTHDVQLVTRDRLPAKMPPLDVIFPVLHGTFGEDGTVQGLFELAGIPYVGAGVAASAVGMDKALMKAIFRDAGLPVVPLVVVRQAELSADEESVLDRIEATLPYPCFTKPANLGSSVGISKARNRPELRAGLRLAARYDQKVLVEQGIQAREMECSVLGNEEPRASVLGEIIPAGEFYDYQAKYHSDQTRLIIPADLPEETAAQIRRLAVDAFRAIDAAGLARVDFFLEISTGRIYVNEINTMPGFTAVSMYPKLWEASGIPYPALLDRLIELALERHAQRAAI